MYREICSYLFKDLRESNWSWGDPKFFSSSNPLEPGAFHPKDPCTFGCQLCQSLRSARCRRYVAVAVANPLQMPSPT